MEECLIRHIFVTDVKQKLSPNTTLRVEAQILHRKMVIKIGCLDWVNCRLHRIGCLHLSDLYNVGTLGYIYYQGYVTYSGGAHRLQLGYGRTRAGFNCSGGVCR